MLNPGGFIMMKDVTRTVTRYDKDPNDDLVEMLNACM